MGPVSHGGPLGRGRGPGAHQSLFLEVTDASWHVADSRVGVAVRRASTRHARYTRLVISILLGRIQLHFEANDALSKN